MKTLLRVFFTFCALFCTELFAGNLKVNLSPAAAVSAGAQWRVDGGSWKNSGATVNGLTNAAHTVDYKTITGWIAPAATTVTVTSGTTTYNAAAYIQTASLKITLTPTSGQWRIDGGTWRASAATVSGLAPGNHTIDYLSVTGYTSPTTETVSLTSGQTTTLARSYIQLASLKLTLSPSTATWRVDGGAWKASGTTVANFTPGAHTVDYNAINGYATPASESVTLTSGQTLSLARSYVQLAQVSVALTPASAQWNIDGGAWQTSGAIVANLALGSHTITYSALSNYTSPASESVTLTAGQSLTLSRSYVQLAQISLTLVPSAGQWRANAGAWQASGASLAVIPGSYLIEYSTQTDYDSPTNETITLAAGGNFTATRTYTTQKPTLRISLTPSTGQWRIDSGTWQPSGSQVAELSAGTHNIDYTDIGGTYNPLPAETISLALRENAVLARSYPIKPPASLSITLNPATARWRVDAGAWQASGTTLSDLAYDVAHMIDYESATGYIAPAAETITPASGQLVSLNRTYTPLASFSVNLTPSSAQWRIDGGAWNTSGPATILNSLALGTHAIEFSEVAGYITPASETVTLASGPNAPLDRSYVALASLNIALATPGAQWRVNNGTWNSGTTFVYNLTLGTHTIDYSNVPGFIAPPSETVTLVSGPNTHTAPGYTSLASLSVFISTPGAKWRVDGGTWNDGFTAIYNLTLSQHTIEYSDVVGYIAPSPQTVTLVSGPNSHNAPGYTSLASLSVFISTPGAKWRVDGGTWNDGFTAIYNLTLSQHTIEYSDVVGYIAPSPQTVTLVSGPNSHNAPSYTSLASLAVFISTPGAKWRIDGGTWNDTPTSLYNLTLGVHTIEYSDVIGYITPASQSITLVSGPNSHTAPGYTSLASLAVFISTPGAKWRIDGGAWNDTPTSLYNLTLGVHTIEYSDVIGYITPASQSITLVSGPNSHTAPSYTSLASLAVFISTPGAKWRIDGGTWNDTPTSLYNLTLGVHTIEYSDVIGYITPASQSITLVSGPNSHTAPSYTSLASLAVTLTTPNAQWRIDGGAWNDSGAIVSNLSIGSHSIEYSSVTGYITPLAESVTLVSGYNPTLTRSYAPEPLPFTQIHAFSDLGTDAVMIPGSDGNFYGVTYSGGSRVRGHVFKMNGDGSNFVSLYAFGTQPNDGLGAQSLTEGRDGVLYGTTDTSGNSSITNKGTLFKLNKDGTGYAILHTYLASLGSEGSTPIAILDGSDGALYGATSSGGTGGGVIFRMGKNGSNYTVIRNLAGSDGLSPKGLIEGPGAVLFGTTNTTLFRMNLDGTGFTVLKNLPAGSTDGAAPRAGLLLASDGVLYGTTSNGGTANRGVAFRVNQDGSNYQVLHHFLGGTLDGLAPWATLTEAPNGRLWGSTVSGGAGSRGTVFSINKDGSNYTIVCPFTANVNDGGLPRQRVWPTSTGTFCASNTSGGATGRGLMFTVNPDGTGFSVLRHWGAPEGSLPISPVTEASNGMLYGTTYSGGMKAAGTIFQINKDGTNFSVLYHFGVTANDATYPLGRLLEGSDGRLYGTGGSLFAMNKDGTGYTLVHLFGTGADGSMAQDGVIEASDGKLYGTTSSGGTGFGTIYRVNKDGTNYSILRNFAGGTGDGQTPTANVIEGNDGRLYGTTSAGGTTGSGTVYVLNKDGSGYSILRHFAGGVGDGAAPNAHLIQSSNGKLYGTTSKGGANGYGTIFGMNLDGSDYAVIKHFAGGIADGSTPYYGALLEKNSVLYGVTNDGGTFNSGVLFSLNLDGSGFTVLINFGAGSLDGVSPQGLTNASDGSIYGTTVFGAGGGSIFRFRTN